MAIIGGDTNILVRLLVGDDPSQYHQGYQLVQQETDMFIADSIILGACPE